jgi:hypothetical protein
MQVLVSSYGWNRCDDAVVVTYCPLCFSGMAFTVRFENVDLDFGVSGLLYTGSPI